MTRGIAQRCGSHIGVCLSPVALQRPGACVAQCGALLSGGVKCEGFWLTPGKSAYRTSEPKTLPFDSHARSLIAETGAGQFLGMPASQVQNPQEGFRHRNLKVGLFTALSRLLNPFQELVNNSSTKPARFGAILGVVGFGKATEPKVLSSLTSKLTR